MKMPDRVVETPVACYRRRVDWTRRQKRPMLPVPDAVQTQSQSLPSDLLTRANSRIRVTAGVTACVGLVRVLMSQVSGVDAVFGTEREVSVKVMFFAAAAVLGLVTFGLTYVRMSHGKHLLVGQIFFVLLCAVFGATESTSAWGDHPFERGVPLPVAILLMYPVIVPMQPLRYLVTSALGVGSVPLAMLTVPHLTGNAPPETMILLLSLVPLVIASAAGAFISKVIYQLGKDLGRAQKMGSYQLIAPLGKGGMGEVWRARHGMLAREAAVKLIRRDRAEKGAEEALQRFEHEARVVAGLRSPRTIQLYDFGVTDDGALYYAMELLDGLDLDQLVSRHGPLPPERVVHFLRQACHSLVEAHEVGLVHRDIKPANLFAARVGRDVDVIKVLDFGLATRPSTQVDSRVTQQGAILGTPAYMAPEQVLGERDLDGRADLYTLGLVAWWLITGRDAFQATAATQVMFAHVNVEPEPPSSYSRLPVPPELDAIVLRCLAKKKGDRFADAEALAQALAAVPLDREWTRERALEWWRDNVTPAPPTIFDAAERSAAIAETR